MFEALDDAGVRTAGTTYLMYRGRHKHEPQRDTALTRVASTLMRHPVFGPRELFYADIFASRRTSCRSGFGMPGVRDRHSGCVSAFMVENDLFDFLLLSLPDNDWYSHKYGPEAQIQSIAQADVQLARVFDACGGVDEFLGEHAVIVMADHSQAPVTSEIALQDALADLGVLGPSRSRAARDERPRIAVCPRPSGFQAKPRRGAKSLLSGGKNFSAASLQEASAAFAQVANEIGTQYSLGYYPADKTRDGRFRQIKVELRGVKDGTVRARDGYYAPKQ